MSDETRYYTFEPEEDITAYEMALVLKSAFHRKIDPESVEWLPARTQRHFQSHVRKPMPSRKPRKSWWQRLFG